MKIDKDKFILDACCGTKGMWVNKNHPNTLYVDIRKKEKGFNSFRPCMEISPDIVADFRKLPFEDKSFKLVVMDPPHLTHSAGENTKDNYLLAYGTLKPYGVWKQEIKEGFKECWRVLEDYGVLIFKWSDNRKSFKEVLDLIEQDPLFGTTSNQRKNSTTRWFTFMKIPKIKK